MPYKSRITRTIQEKIRQRRSQMLVHSYLYYRLDSSIVIDDDWQRWADELVSLQREYTKSIGFYDAEFKKWDGSTGYHLPQDDYVHYKTMQLLQPVESVGQVHEKILNHVKRFFYGAS